MLAAADVGRAVPRRGDLGLRPAEATRELVRGGALEIDRSVDLLGAPGGDRVGHGVELHSFRLGDLANLLHAGVAEPGGVDLTGSVRPRHEEVGPPHDRGSVEEGLERPVREENRGFQLDRRTVALGALLVPRGNVSLVDDDPQLLLVQAAGLVGDEARVCGQAVPDQRRVPADHVAERLPELERVLVEWLPGVIAGASLGGLGLAERVVGLGEGQGLGGDARDGDLGSNRSGGNGLLHRKLTFSLKRETIFALRRECAFKRYFQSLNARN